jgi:ankyrin repeat protein
MEDLDLDLDAKMMEVVSLNDLDTALTGIRQLVEVGANINAQDEHRNTPLILACSRGRRILVHQLLKLGADPTLANDQNVTPLMWAMAANNYAIIQIINLLLNAGANLDARDIYGQTALHWAVQENALEAVEYLIDDHKMDVDDSNLYGSTPLHLAVEHGHGDMVRLLLSRGADVWATDLEGNTSLHIICESGNPTKEHIMRMLLARGSQVNQMNNQGQTPLMLLVRSMQIRDNQHDLHLIDLLLSYGADLEMRDRQGNTAYLYARLLGLDEPAIYLKHISYPTWFQKVYDL